MGIAQSDTSNVLGDILEALLMKTPIVHYIVNGEDITFYASVEDVFVDIELDHADPADKFYDAEGRLLEIAGDRESGFTLRELENLPSQQEDFRKLLADYFQRAVEGYRRRGERWGIELIGYSADEIASLSLSQLIDLSWKFVYRPPRKRWWHGWLW